LKRGTRSLFWLRQRVVDHTGHQLPGDEHIAGWLLRSSEVLTIRFLDTIPGRTAGVMVEEELVDAVVGADGKVRLVAGPEPPVTIRFADLQAQTQAERTDRWT
jgi:hypothetical protein